MTNIHQLIQSIHDAQEIITIAQALECYLKATDDKTFLLLLEPGFKLLATDQQAHLEPALQAQDWQLIDTPIQMQVADENYGIYPALRFDRTVFILAAAGRDPDDALYNLMIELVHQRFDALGPNTQSLSTFQQLVDQATVAIDLCDNQGNVIYYNRAWASLYGIPAEHTLLEHRFQKSDWELLKTQFFRFNREIGEWQGYFSLLKQNRTQFDAHLAVFVVKDEDGVPIGFSTVTDDVTPLQLALDSTEYQRKRLMAAIEISRLIMRETDIQTLYETATRVICETFNYTAAEILLYTANNNTLTCIAAYSTQGNDQVFHEEPINYKIDLDFEIEKNWAVQNQQKVIIVDARETNKTLFSHLITTPLEAEAVFPLRTGDIVKGVLAVQCDIQHTFLPDDVEVLQSISDMMSVSLHNTQLIQELKARLADLSASTDVSLLVHTTYNLEELKERLYRALKRINPHIVFEFTIYNFNNNVVETTRFQHNQRESKGQIPLEEQAIITYVIRENAPLLWRNDKEKELSLASLNVPSDNYPSSYLALPLLARNSVIGMMSIEMDIANIFDENDLQLMVALANSAAFAVDSMNLFNSMNQRVREMSALNEISHTLSSRFGRKDVWEALQLQITDLFDFAQLKLGFFDKGLSTLRYVNGQQSEQPSAMVQSVITSQEIVYIEDIQQQQTAYDAMRDTLTKAGFRSWLGAPLKSRTGELMGIVSLASALPHAFRHSIALFMTLITQVELALENELLLGKEKQQRFMANQLINIGSEVNSTLSIIEVTRRILDQLDTILPVDKAGIWILPNQKPLTHIRLIAGKGHTPSAIGGRLKLEADIPFSRLIVKEEMVYLPETTYFPLEKDRKEPGSWLAVPLISQSRVMGALSVQARHSHAYEEHQLQGMSLLAQQIANAIENALLHEEVELNLVTLKRRAHRLSVMHEISTLVASTFFPTKVLDEVSQLLARMLNCDHAGIVIIGEDDNGYLAAEYPDYGLVGNLVIPKDSPNYQNLQQLAHKPRINLVTVKNIEEVFGSRESQIVINYLEAGFRKTIIAPLVARNEIFGTIGMDTLDPNFKFTEGDQEALMMVASQIAMALYNGRIYEEAVDANRLKSEFLANISHELRTPLNAILGYSEMLLNGIYGEVNSKQMDRLKRVYENGTNLRNLISDILDLSRMEAGRLTINSVPISLTLIIRELSRDFKSLAEAKGLTYTVDCQAGIGDIPVDPGRIRQILINLLTNALKFTHEGQVSISLKQIDVIENMCQTAPLPNNIIVPDGEWQWICVADTGIGIRPEDHYWIFEAFRQVDSSSIREYEGTGLGLAITRHLVNMHQGYIWVESERGQGSHFYVLLPLHVHKENNFNNQV